MQWCVQALPECGSFQQSVHRAIFPAILEAKKAEDAGKPQSVAVAEAVPTLIEAMSKGMACREMCEAAVNTCSCGTSGGSGITFGQAIMDAEKSDKGFAAVRIRAVCDSVAPQLNAVRLPAVHVSTISLSSMMHLVFLVHAIVWPAMLLDPSLHSHAT